MAIEFRCNQCGQLLRVPEDSAGKHARCPKCQALMAVPQPAAIELPIQSPAETSAAPNALPLPSTAVATPPEKSVNESPFAPAPLPTTEPGATSAGNPFGEKVGENPFAGPTAGNLNPYASPATFTSYQPTYDMAGLRTGLPWDTEPRTFGCWFRTVRIILGMPSQAFLMMHQHGGLGPPIRYSIYGIGMPAAAAMVLAVPILFLILAAQPAGNETFGVLILGVLAIVLGVTVYILLIATVGNLIAAAIWHLFLMLVGGARQPYETTFRVTAYVYGSLMWLNFIPYIGGCAASIWIIVLLIIGLSKAHEIPAGKAVLAVLLPFGLCVGVYFFFILSFVVGLPFLERLGG
jgi:phage FluMu protein Com